MYVLQTPQPTIKLKYIVIIVYIKLCPNIRFLLYLALIDFIYDFSMLNRFYLY